MAYKFSLGKYKHSGSLVSAEGLQVTGAVDLPNDSIQNAELVNDSVTIGSTAVVLGSTVTAFSGITSLSATAFTGSGAQITNITASNIDNFTADVRKQVGAVANSGLAYNAGAGTFAIQLSGSGLRTGSSGLGLDIEVTTAGASSNGALSFDSHTGGLTFTPVADSWVRGLVTGGDGLVYDLASGDFDVVPAGAMAIKNDKVAISASVAGGGLSANTDADGAVTALNINTAGAMAIKNDKVALSASVAGVALAAVVDGDGAVTALDVQVSGAVTVSGDDKLILKQGLAGTGLNKVTSSVEGLTQISVAYGSAAGTAVQGDVAWSATAGNGLTGDASGQLGAGASFTFAVGAGNGIEVAADSVAVKLSGAAGNQALVVNADGLDLKATIAGNRTFSNDVTVNGNFYVYGSTISASVSELLVEDAKIRIADGAPALSASQGFEIGNNLATFVVGDGSATNSAFVSSLELKASKFIGAVEGTVAEGIQLASATATANKSIVLCDAASAGFTLTLPAASSWTGQFIKVKKSDTTENAVVVAPAAGTIDGVSSISLDSPRAAVMLVSDGSNWFIF